MKILTPVNSKTKEWAESKNRRIVYLGKKMLKLENFEKVFLFPVRWFYAITDMGYNNMAKQTKLDLENYFKKFYLYPPDEWRRKVTYSLQMLEEILKNQKMRDLDSESEDSEFDDLESAIRSLKRQLGWFW